MPAPLDKLRAELLRLRSELAERRAAMPAHSARPSQLLALEELEEEIAAKAGELRELEEREGKKGVESG